MASQAHLRNVFYRMGFGDEGIVALSGAHTLGRAHKVRGGRSERAELAPCLCVELMNSRDLDEYILKYRSNTIIDKWTGMNMKSSFWTRVIVHVLPDTTGPKRRGRGNLKVYEGRRLPTRCREGGSGLVHRRKCVDCGVAQVRQQVDFGKQATRIYFTWCGRYDTHTFRKEQYRFCNQRHRITRDIIHTVPRCGQKQVYHLLHDWVIFILDHIYVYIYIFFSYSVFRLLIISKLDRFIKNKKRALKSPKPVAENTSGLTNWMF